MDVRRWCGVKEKTRTVETGLNTQVSTTAKARKPNIQCDNSVVTAVAHYEVTDLCGATMSNAGEVLTVGTASILTVPSLRDPSNPCLQTSSGDESTCGTVYQHRAEQNFSEIEDGDQVIEAFFESLDRDKNGRLSWAEIKAALCEYERRSSVKLMDLLKNMEEVLNCDTDPNAQAGGLREELDLTRFKEIVKKVPRIHGERFQWVQSLNLNVLLARRLKLGNLFDELSGIRDMTQEEMDTALSSFFKDVVSAVNLELTELKKLGSNLSGFEKVEAAMSKYAGHVGTFGDTQMFQEGLENQIGSPDPFILKGIFRDNVLSEQAKERSLTTEYKIVYSSQQEFARVFGNPLEYERDPPLEYERDPSSTMKEEETAKDIPIFLMEVAKGLHPEIKGPTEAELKDLDTAFLELRELHNTIRESNQGVFPGDIGNVQQCTEVEFEGCDEDSAIECHANLIEFTAHQKDTSFFVDPGQRPSSHRFRISIYGTLAFFASRKKHRLIESFKHSHLSVQTRNCSEFDRTYIYCNLEHEKPLNLRELLTNLTFFELCHISTLAESASKDEHIDFIISLAQAGSRVVCIQGRRHLCLRQLMDLKAIKEAGLRVEEAVQVYQYTGPVFQVSSTSVAPTVQKVFLKLVCGSSLLYFTMLFVIDGRAGTRYSVACLSAALRRTAGGKQTQLRYPVLQQKTKNLLKIANPHRSTRW
jgi:hypothetical protein